MFPKFGFRFDKLFIGWGRSGEYDHQHTVNILPGVGWQWYGDMTWKWRRTVTLMREGSVCEECGKKDWKWWLHDNCIPF